MIDTGRTAATRRRRLNAYLRSVLAALAGVLAALAAAVLPLDGEPFVVLSVGTATGLVVARAAGAPVAVPGALAGALLGYRAMGALTAVAAAVAAANLAVVAWQRAAPYPSPR